MKPTWKWKNPSIFLRQTIHIVLFFVLFFLHINSCYAAAWLQPKGEGVIIANAQQYVSCHYWNLEGNLQSGPCFNQLSINPYIEYGALDEVTVGVNPFLRRLSQAGAIDPLGLDNITFFGRFLNKHKNWSTLSTQLSYNQPFRSADFGQTPSSAYAIVGRERYADIRLLGGTGGQFDPKAYNTWYANMEAAYRPFFDGAADELHLDLMIGWKTLNQRLVLELQELNTFGLHNPSNATQPNYNVFTVMPNIIYWYFQSLAVQVGVQQDLYGTNIGRGTAPFIALWWKF